jgi:hypothetical protein
MSDIEIQKIISVIEYKKLQKNKDVKTAINLAIRILGYHGRSDVEILKSKALQYMQNPKSSDFKSDSQTQRLPSIPTQRLPSIPTQRLPSIPTQRLPSTQTQQTQRRLQSTQNQQRPSSRENTPVIIPANYNISPRELKQQINTLNSIGLARQIEAEENGLYFDTSSVDLKQQAEEFERLKQMREQSISRNFMENRRSQEELKRNNREPTIQVPNRPDLRPSGFEILPSVSNSQVENKQKRYLFHEEILVSDYDSQKLYAIYQKNAAEYQQLYEEINNITATLINDENDPKVKNIIIHEDIINSDIRLFTESLCKFVVENRIYNVQFLLKAFTVSMEYYKKKSIDLEKLNIIQYFLQKISFAHELEQKSKTNYIDLKDINKFLATGSENTDKIRLLYYMINPDVKSTPLFFIYYLEKLKIIKNYKQIYYRNASYNLSYLNNFLILIKCFPWLYAENVQTENKIKKKLPKPVLHNPDDEKVSFIIDDRSYYNKGEIMANACSSISIVLSLNHIYFYNTIHNLPVNEKIQRLVTYTFIDQILILDAILKRRKDAMLVEDNFRHACKEFDITIYIYTTHLQDQSYFHSYSLDFRKENFTTLGPNDVHYAGLVNPQTQHTLFLFYVNNHYSILPSINGCFENNLQAVDVQKYYDNSSLLALYKHCFENIFINGIYHVT